jgi:hypothetical protein
VVFAEHWADDKLPDIKEIAKAVKWAYEPRVMYAAGFRDESGPGMGMFAGPCKNLEDVLAEEPPEHPYARKAFIMKLTRTGTYRDGPIMEPVARWHKGKWQRKKAK